MIEILELIVKITVALYVLKITLDLTFRDRQGVRVKMDYYERNDVKVFDIIDLTYKFFGDDINSKEAFYIGNIIKYLMRYKFKGDPNRDLDKLDDYLNLLNEELNRQVNSKELIK